MGVLERLRPAWLGAWIFALSAALLLAWGAMGQTPAHADDAAQMSISISGSGVSCSGDVCSVELSSTFTASVTVDDAPDAGYILVQAFIDYGTSLTYNRTEDRADEVLWPDVASDQVIVRAEIAAGQVNHGGLTGLIPPLPISEYEGPVFEIALTCTDAASSTNLQLLPEGDAVALTNGALFTLENAETVIPKVNSVTVNCEASGGNGLPVDGGLPSTGYGMAGSDGSSTSIIVWLAIAALVVAGAAGLGTGWRAARLPVKK